MEESVVQFCSSDNFEVRLGPISEQDEEEASSEASLLILEPDVPLSTIRP